MKKEFEAAEMKFIMLGHSTIVTSLETKTQYQEQEEEEKKQLPKEEEEGPY